MLDVKMATLSDPGRRASNEDALCVGSADHGWFAILSDGAGGHERGAEAALRVVSHVETTLRAQVRAFGPGALTSALCAAHAELQAGQVGLEGARRMHATAVVLWIDGLADRALWSHVGDSRLYRIRYGKVDVVTADDSVVQRMVEGGVLTARQAQEHPMKNRLLAAIGMKEPLAPHTPAQAATLEDGDAFLLCTDGWWTALDEADLTATLSDADTPQAWLEAMRALIAARATEGQDNFSAIAVWASDPAESTQSMAQEEDLPANGL
jgi:serine/threonine protein phosphatase PrpC